MMSFDIAALGESGDKGWAAMDPNKKKHLGSGVHRCAPFRLPDAESGGLSFIKEMCYAL